MGEILIKKISDWIYKNPGDCNQIRKRMMYVTFGLVFVGICLVMGLIVLMNLFS